MREVRIKLVSKDPISDYPVTKPEDAIVLMQTIIGDMANEYFAAVFLNAKNKPLDFTIAGIGDVSASRIFPSAVLKGALIQNAPRVMLFHNHPSGEINPSPADIVSTQKFILAARLQDIELLDHVIVTDDEYFSFAENGLLDISNQEYMEGLRELKNLSVEEFNEKYSFRINGNYYSEISAEMMPD